MEKKCLLIAISKRDSIKKLLSMPDERMSGNKLLFMAEGSAHYLPLKMLGLDKTSKEIALITIDEKDQKDLLFFFDMVLNLSEKNTGIAFTVPMKLIGNKSAFAKEGIRSEDYPYHLVCVIVDEGKSKECIESAQRVLVRGGTILSARGGGMPKDYYFPLTIEPQKDIVLILVKNQDLEKITFTLTKDLDLEKAANGVLFTLPVNMAVGLPLAEDEGGINQ